MADLLQKEILETEKEILANKYKTALIKVQFANELKQGLGDEMKKNPSQVKIIQKTRGERFKIWLTKIFTKF